MPGKPGIQILSLGETVLQWGWSEIGSFEILKDLKARLFEGQISNVPVFKWWGYSYSLIHIKHIKLKMQAKISWISPTLHLINPWPLFSFIKVIQLKRIYTFIHSFIHWFWTKWWPFVQILNGWAFRFQIPFKIQWLFATQPLLNHSKSGLGQISDPHCIWISNYFSYC